MIPMENANQFTDAMTYERAIRILNDAGVLTSNGLFRDAHTSVSFAGVTIDATGSPLTQRKVSETDWIRMLGHLVAEVAERGLRPAELLAIGFASALQRVEEPT